ncbi:MAG: RNA polymerase sigma factor [Candidatus Limnocylindria bacterium]
MNREHWERIYEGAFPVVYRALVAMGARPDEAEDALHEAFERALGRDQLERPDGWLFVTAVRRWRRRRIRDRIFRPLAFLDAGSSDPPEDERVTLFAEMRRLPLRQRQVLVARYVLGYSQDETASLLGIARGTVAATTSQAAAALRRRLGSR